MPTLNTCHLRQELKEASQRPAFFTMMHIVVLLSYIFVAVVVWLCCVSSPQNNTLLPCFLSVPKIGEPRPPLYGPPWSFPQRNCLALAEKYTYSHKNPSSKYDPNPLRLILLFEPLLHSLVCAKRVPQESALSLERNFSCDTARKSASSFWIWKYSKYYRMYFS